MFMPRFKLLSLLVRLTISLSVLLLVTLWPLLRPMVSIWIALICPILWPRLLILSISWSRLLNVCRWMFGASMVFPLLVLLLLLALASCLRRCLLMSVPLILPKTPQMTNVEFLERLGDDLSLLRTAVDFTANDFHTSTESRLAFNHISAVMSEVINFVDEMEAFACDQE